MKSSREISILLLVAMGLTLLPASLDAACDMTAHPDVDPCDTFLDDTCDGPSCGREPGHRDHDRCENGCQHCSLPCCSGTVMIPAAAQMLDEVLPADGRLVATATDVTWVDADPVYHPPRG
ncbi:MAG: hypothetical protein ABFS42_04665 [Candidatus Krumholzibacteriota bacterium]